MGSFSGRRRRHRYEDAEHITLIRKQRPCPSPWQRTVLFGGQSKAPDVTLNCLTLQWGGWPNLGLKLNSCHLHTEAELTLFSKGRN